MHFHYLQSAVFWMRRIGILCILMKTVDIFLLRKPSIFIVWRLTAVPVPLVATAYLSRSIFCSSPEPDPSLQLPRLPIASKQRLLVCCLQAQPSSQTPLMSAKDTCVDKIRFVTLSQSDLLKEKARVMLLHQWCNRKAKAGLPELHSHFILCVGCKRLFQQLLT